MKSALFVCLSTCLALASSACGSDTLTAPADTTTASTTTTTAAGGAGGATATGQGGATGSQGGAGGASAGGHGGTASAGGAGAGGSPGAPTAADLLKLTATCASPSDGLYATDDGEAETIPICMLDGAFFWTADLDVDCDGKETAVCNGTTDPSFSAGTSLEDSNGDPLDASTLPFFVIPLQSARFDYQAAGIELGAVGAVIYKGKVVYGVFGDEGPSGILGEGSYAMAQALGIDPDPATGGVDSGVTYLVFTGGGAVPSPVESHAAATALGEALAAALVAKN